MATKPRRKSVDKWITNDPHIWYMGDEYNHDFHFFATSWDNYRVGTNLVEMIDYFHKKQAPFRLWRIPQSVDIDYRIENYIPQVKGAELLVAYSLKEHSEPL